jgi:DNA-binding transcriptional LysR family regulator
MSIDIRNLRCFVGIVSAGLILNAAEILHIAQPSLSVQLKALEEELETPVLDRTP